MTLTPATTRCRERLHSPIIYAGEKAGLVCVNCPDAKPVEKVETFDTPETLFDEKAAT